MIHRHLLQDGRPVVCDDNFALRGLHLSVYRSQKTNHEKSQYELSLLPTILSMPRGPRLVLTASAIAADT